MLVKALLVLAAAMCTAASSCPINPACANATAANGGRSPCLHYGTCFDTMWGGWACACRTGYYGRTCSINPNDCYSYRVPCLNGGTCIDGLQDYTCKCAPGFEGHLCQTAETQRNYCVSTPCVEAHCTEPACTNDPKRSTYKCNCLPGYTGRECEAVVSYCAHGSPCLNGGTCAGYGLGYACVCPKGTFGERCQLTMDNYLNATGQEHLVPCDLSRPANWGHVPAPASPCGAQGVCLAYGTTDSLLWTCACLGGTTGDLCDQNA